MNYQPTPEDIAEGKENLRAQERVLGPFGLSEYGDDRDFGLCIEGKRFDDDDEDENTETNDYAHTNEKHPTSEVFLPSGDPNQNFWEKRSKDICQTVHDIDSDVEKGFTNLFMACKNEGISEDDYYACSALVDNHKDSNIGSTIDMTKTNNVDAEKLSDNPYFSMTDRELGMLEDAITICDVNSKSMLEYKSETGMYIDDVYRTAHRMIGAKALAKNGVYPVRSYLEEKTSKFMEKFHGNTDAARANRNEALAFIKEVKRQKQQSGRK